MIPLGQTVEIPGFELLMEKRLQGSNMGSNRFRVDMPRYIDLYLQGRLKLDELVSQRISLDEVNEGFEAPARRPPPGPPPPSNVGWKRAS